MQSTTTRAGLRGAVLLLVGSVLLTACSDEPDSTGTAAAETTASATTASATPGPVPVPVPVALPGIEPARAAPIDLTGAAVDEFGADEVQRAYDWVVGYLDMTTFRPEIIQNDPARTAAAYEFATEHMTPEMAANYRALVDAAFADEPDAGVRLCVHSFFNVNSTPDMAFREPLVADHTVTGPVASVGAEGQLVIAVREDGTFQLTHSGQASHLHIWKDVTLTLVPGAGPHEWLVESYEGTWQQDAAEYDTATA